MSFVVNGKTYDIKGNKSLLRFLRDDLRLTSVKDGCSEGACGACTVIIDGRTVRACVLNLQKCEGKNIITVEGLTKKEQSLYSYAFGKVGAVQCGFCIPGMVMCAKALLDKNNNPANEEIVSAIKNNYCRCTGYVKIIQAIKLAGDCIRNNEIPDDLEESFDVGGESH